MRKVWSVLTIASLWLGLVGCQTSRRPLLPLTTVKVPGDIVVAPAAPLVPSVVAMPSSPAPVRSNLVVTPVPPPAPNSATNVTVSPTSINPTPSPAHLESGWIPWARWSEGNRLGPPHRVTTTANAMHPTYEVRDENHWFTLKIGSSLAYYNGLECWLGFPPRLLHGLPHIHALDAEKILQPLLGAPAAFTNALRTIVLDPGHGGHDSGTRSAAANAFEKQYTLDWAQRLRDLFLARGWRVHLTRTNDVDVSLADRVALADRVNAALFVSLHFNSGDPNQELHGIETYCLTPAGMPSNLTRDYEDDLKRVFPNNNFDAENLQHAARLHRALVMSTRAEDRGLRHARFMGVLRGQNRPAVLIEGGYLSNPSEARRIGTPAYRQTLAEAVARALE